MKSLCCAVAVLALLGAACTDEDRTGNPQPIGLPGPVVAGRVYLTDVSGYVAGVPTAVPEVTEGTEVVVEMLTDGQRSGLVRRAVRPDGSFLVEAIFSPGQRVDLWVVRGEAESSKISIDVRALDPLPRGPVLDSVSPVADGRTTVSGTWGPTLVVVVGNRDRGAAASGTVDTDGRFSIVIEAAAGDRLVLFGPGSGGSLNLRVPTP